MKISFEYVTSECDSDWEMPKIGIEGTPGRIRPNERRNRNDHQNDTAGGFDGKKALYRSQDTSNAFARQ